MTAYTPKTSDDAVKAKTGKTWAQWFALLDRWGAATKGHPATAAYLHDEHSVPAWWSQMVTVEYERARGLRAVGQRTTGDWEASLQRTVPASAADALAAWTDARARARWLTHPLLKEARAALAKARSSDTAMGTMLRCEPGGSAGATKLHVAFQPKGPGACAVRVQHTRLASAKERDALREAWREALDALKARLGA